jgi:hypothetical protein
MASKQVEQHLSANSYIKKKDIVIGNFLGGVAWGLGTVIGASVIVGILVGVLNFFGWTDFIKQFFPS